jgi:hypothetical protein
MIHDRRDKEIISSIEDCLLDSSDMGFSIQCYHYENVYKVRIITPRALSSNRSNPNQLDNYFDRVPERPDLNNILYFDNDGAKTYEKVKKDLKFLCSYIPDMYGLIIKKMKVDFVKPKYNSLVEMNTSIEPIYWGKSSTWINLLERNCLFGFMNSDIVTIDIQFEREMPKDIDIEKWIDDFIKDDLSIKRSWIRRVINKLFT